MRRIIIIGGVLVGVAFVVAAVRRGRGAKLHERLMARCEAMFERLPHSTPGAAPKLHERMMKQCEAMFQQKRATPTAENANEAGEERCVVCAGASAAN